MCMTKFRLIYEFYLLFRSLKIQNQMSLGKFELYRFNYSIPLCKSRRYVHYSCTVILKHEKEVQPTDPLERIIKYLC